MIATDATFSKDDIAGFNGSETFYQHWIVRPVLYTEGVRYLAEHAGAYWLIDEIAFAQMARKKVRDAPFQAWTLTVHGSEAVLRATDGDRGDGPVTLFRKEITFTDFPLDEITLFAAANGHGVTIMLPSEY